MVRLIKEGYESWKETPFTLFYDGERHTLSKYTKDQFSDHPKMVIPQYNRVTDTLYYVGIIDGEDVGEKFINSSEAMEYLENYYTYGNAYDESIKRNKRRMKESFSNDRYEEAQNYIDNGMTTWREIFQDCSEIARTDKELKQSMIDQCGSISKYAEEIFDAVQNILGNETNESVKKKNSKSLRENLDGVDGYAVDIHDMGKGYHHLLLFTDKDTADSAYDGLVECEEYADRGVDDDGYEYDEYALDDGINQISGMADEIVNEVDMRREVDRNDIWTAADDTRYKIVGSVDLWIYW